jgi:hypothetical protein
VFIMIGGNERSSMKYSKTQIFNSNSVETKRTGTKADSTDSSQNAKVVAY